MWISIYTRDMKNDEIWIMKQSYIEKMVFVSINIRD